MLLYSHWLQCHGYDYYSGDDVGLSDRPANRAESQCYSSAHAAFLDGIHDRFVLAIIDYGHLFIRGQFHFVDGQFNFVDGQLIFSNNICARLLDIPSDYRHYDKLRRLFLRWRGSGPRR
ncbi:hypothetical protein LTR56_014438 [Elasticomyces elasticus]|nr:hypothetical protein LTR56_014438 [Elasticomyces elasticus]KAK3646496.1 hypothetical protein LTR22_014259 [Elasticomyces elasticus]KAK4908587.1 hypothetical protein LTR49_022545 [Elasticomyces elasticus]KAK5755693.1 hypothetical protein LTS12_014254 [Elasticomyces elasticus]